MISFTCDTSGARATIAPLKRLSQARLSALLENTAPRAELLEGQWAPRVRIVGGHLEKILKKRADPAREPLLWHNAYFGRGRRSVMVRGGVTAVNSPQLHTAKLLDEILKYAYIPKEVVEAYRDQASDKRLSGRSKSARELRVVVLGTRR